MRFTQGLHRSAQQKPDALATACAGRVRTHRELHARVGRLAGGLLETGIHRGTRVCILSLNSDRYLESYLTLAWIGAVAVPANYRWSVPEIVYSINDADCGAIIVDDYFAPRVDAIRQQCPRLRTVIFAGDGEPPRQAAIFEELATAGSHSADAHVGGDEIFGIFYTGGTTGKPKGVMLSHLNLCTSALAMMAEGPFAEGAVGLHIAPMFHLADMVMVTGLLLRGAGHVMLGAFNPESALSHIARHDVTDTLVVPAMLQALVDCPTLKQHDCGSLRRILYGASPISETLLDRAMQAFPHVEFLQGYGMTETAGLIAVLPPAMHGPRGREAGRLRSCGRGTCHVGVRVVDGNGNEVPHGRIGEIVARGPNIMKGYLNLAEASTEALRDGWMHTGDLGYMDEEGYLFIVDRLKDMIITGGENVYSIEVENIIARHPAVHSVVVIGIPCAEKGEKIHAAIVPKTGMTLTLEELQAHCREHLAGYKLPRSMEVRENLPLSGAGKVLKTELRKPYWRHSDRAVS